MWEEEVELRRWEEGKWIEEISCRVARGALT
jgi:hypothetical protein